MSLLITGCAGFIGYHLTKQRLQEGDHVVGVDSLNPYYDVSLKQARLAQLQAYSNFAFYPINITDSEAIPNLFATHQPKQVINLAAQAGVRYSLQNPLAYIQDNVLGFTNLIEACRLHQVEHLIYASSSSVYAGGTLPYQEKDPTNHPLNVYAATKKSNELIAHAYSHLYQLPTTGLRFFTVYGPWGRPDMALFTFTRNILAGLPIEIYNHGNMRRDFTYVDDIIAGISSVIDSPATPNPAWSKEAPDTGSSSAPYRIYNIGRGNPVNLMDYIQAIEEALGKETEKIFLPLQKGDAQASHADVSRITEQYGYQPRVNIKEGVERFVEWYLRYY